MAFLLHPLFKTFPMLTSSLKLGVLYSLDCSVSTAASHGKNFKSKGDLILATSKCSHNCLTSMKNPFSSATLSSTFNAEILLHNYLSCADSLIQRLEKNSEIGSKLNTLLCSSERLFSLAEHVLHT